ncbi:unnamed protein product [Ilex paraguariensis]|uniref:Hydroxyproline-rich glycoprotein family protein n=1 Tax=Ilex paraguariensis TaxID=185542 RepID=A0ABC8UE03_9AQUA
MPEANALANQPNGPQAFGLTNQTTTLAPSLLAPPSSPASFSNSALPSTAQSPSCRFSLSANSPGGHSSTLFRAGPYAHETQLVSPPVFSTFTTEPSTAPFTPPPELAHLTTPSSPDVPFAQFLSSSMDLKSTDKTDYIPANDLRSTYSLYPGSPASSLMSPISRTSGDCLSSSFRERDFPPQWDPSLITQETKYSRSESGKLFGLDTGSISKLSQDSNFFCPATFAQFYLDHSSFPHSGGRLSVSRESDVYCNGGNGHQNRQSRTCKQEVEEIEAYRASFGFSADEIVTTHQYVEISDVLDSFTIMPFTSNVPHVEASTLTSTNDEPESEGTPMKLQSPESKSELDYTGEGICDEVPSSCNGLEDHASQRQPGDVSRRAIPGNQILRDDDDDIFSKMGASRVRRKYPMGSSNSDAEIDYRRGRRLREGKGNF